MVPTVTNRALRQILCIGPLKRRHGLRRSLYKKDAGLKRWVGLGVIADNLINLGRAMAK